MSRSYVHLRATTRFTFDLAVTCFGERLNLPRQLCEGLARCLEVNR